MTRKAEGGTMIGILDDWDLAVDIAEISSEHYTGMRTGARPFMSMEFHRSFPPAHKLRFDWESFFYFLIWSAFVIPPQHTDQKKQAEEEAKARAQAKSKIGRAHV